jgi:uncharacterized membrane protein
LNEGETMEFMTYLEPIFRWGHIIAGITWIGLLYYFNFMNGHIVATMDADTKKKVVPELMPRVLFWFRWGAAWTWLTGVFLLAIVYYHGGLMFEGDAGWTAQAGVMVAVTLLGLHVYDLLFKFVKNHNVAVAIGFILIIAVINAFLYWAGFSYRAYVIHTGALFGTIMAFNVWFRIWPAQKKIITAIKNGDKPDAAWGALAGMRSKHNTYLSVPLIWAMINAHNTSYAGCQWTLVAAVAVGWIFVYWLYKKGASVKGF